MENVVIGLASIAVGALLAFRGNVALRVVLALWGAFAGFWLGAALASATTGAPLLAGPVGWIAAVAGAVVAGSLAYAVYAIAVVIAFGGWGLVLGTALAASLGGGGGVAPVVAGTIGAVALAILALVTRLPFVLLVLLSASAGAAAITAGVQLVLGLVTPGADAAAIEEALAGQWWWTIVYLAIAGAGVLVQLRGSRPDPRAQWQSTDPAARA